VFLSKPDFYSVYDMLGRLVISEKEVASLDISKLTVGTYIIKNSKGISQKLSVK
jgi:hypothetical protein